MTFEADGTRVVQPLDPSQGTRYSEPAEDQMEGRSNILGKVQPAMIHMFVSHPVFKIRDANKANKK